MSARQQAAAAILTQLAFAADGALLGVALTYVAVRSFLKFNSTISAIRKISEAPFVGVSDLRCILSEEISASSGDNSVVCDCEGEVGKMVVVRGAVEAKSAVDGSGKSLWSDVLVSHESGDKAVVIQRTQTYIYNEWRGFFGWTSDIRAVLGRTWREQQSSSTRMVPFILIDGDQQPQVDYAVVNLDGSKHELPLTTVYHQMQPINASPYTFLQALFGYEYPVGLLDEEKILQLGKDVTAVGICYSNNGVPEIKSCRDLPYFLSDLTKDQMVGELSFRCRILLWSCFIFGALSIGILGYAIMRNWNKWKEWQEQRRARQQRLDSSATADSQVAGEDEEAGDVPDGQLCVICLMRRRRSAFIPCGHLVCCRACALSIERDLSPKCPLCRQTIRSSVRIYDS
ncbi:hypothetical protein Nepgr_017877 [Nepenthes gracilis]|uniref:RING-type E3 ubiquitin transferase n=1 Tax=Nepenthes gracilis TaxID=150966 RepID=A0AAD3XTR5_NEPGR|nr:hypothetical protein Nepgr_017877 [Nepenthes gracilis]